MIGSYKVVKNKYPDASPRELYAHALELRPAWKRENESSFDFIRGKDKFKIKQSDKFSDVIRSVIAFETIPSSSSTDDIFIFMKEIMLVISEELKEFIE